MPLHVILSDSIGGPLAPVYERLGLQPGRLELHDGIWRGRGARLTTALCRARRATAAGAALDGAPELVAGSVRHPRQRCRDFLEPASANLVHEAPGLSRHGVRVRCP